MVDGPRNRKQRRAAANDACGDFSIPLAYPPTEGDAPKSKTLYEVIAERQRELQAKQGISAGPDTFDPSKLPKGTRMVTVDGSGKIIPLDETDRSSISSTAEDERETETEGEGEEEEEAIPPFIDTLLLSFPLSALHLTLAYLAAHQYAQEIHLGALIHESVVIVFPLLTFLIHLAHGHIISFGKKNINNNNNNNKKKKKDERPLSTTLLQLTFPPRTLLFLPLAIYLGARLIELTNDDPYYAVMKRAPAIGTMWVWSILEMSVGGAFLGALAPLSWGVWYKGYILF
ncbi:hypothetical protein ASPZODRAFT_126980 [Penicilliopsis zonata CBS 506.65]|uniref:DUF7719 domain-containing protein n=1 Tax=Penicilliopsis zonata CBS 506.65 TaxID=1073090 RepID=A0A1L9SV27_9EURO|nr:hypothetical protein ASPZODRAFT_126980 [Penicilliopsis zonata CBS 506.65]OJJ50996.1 hypothetical protein ASPZODRAFT_126980 [Penicilliopsis zonata CBS 506.65]